MIELIKRIYVATVLKQPVVVCVLMAAILAFFAMQTPDFKLDASADSLLLDDDADLKVFRETLDRYATKEFLFVTFTPDEDLFSENSITQITNLRNE